MSEHDKPVDPNEVGPLPESDIELNPEVENFRQKIQAVIEKITSEIELQTTLGLEVGRSELQKLIREANIDGPTLTDLIRTFSTTSTLPPDEKKRVTDEAAAQVRQLFNLIETPSLEAKPTVEVGALSKDEQLNAARIEYHSLIAVEEELEKGLPPKTDAAAIDLRLLEFYPHLDFLKSQPNSELQKYGSAAVEHFKETILPKGEARYQELLNRRTEAYIEMAKSHGADPARIAEFARLNAVIAQIDAIDESIINDPAPFSTEITIALGNAQDYEVPELIVGAETISPRNADITAFRREVIDVVVNRAQSRLEKLARVAKNFERSNAPKSPAQMDIHEVVQELGERMFPGERSLELKQQYLKLIGDVQNEHLKAFYKTKVALQQVANAGDSGAKDFGVSFGRIMPTMAENSFAFSDLSRSLFYVAPKDNEVLKVEELEKLPINTAAIEMWRYAVARIRGGGKRGGLARDPDDPTDKTDFSYPRLTDVNVDAFKTHLKEKFGDSVGPESVDLMITYIQQLAAKSVGYIPWLMREQTRSHGGILANLKSEPFVDELFNAAPFAAGFYSRSRYGNSKPDATAGDMLFMDKNLVVDVVGEATDLKKSPEKAEVVHEEQHKAGELWELIKEFRETVWGTIPEWVTDVKEMIRDGRLDIDGSWFPLPGEIVVDLMDVEQEKREISEMRDGEEKNRKMAEFVKKYKAQGYGPTWERIGIKKLLEIDVGQYMFAFDAMGKMISAFQTQPREMNREEIIKEFDNVWMGSILGKAKLMPGRHHLLFGPMTVYFIHRLTHSFVDRNSKDEVERLVRELLEELRAAGGVTDETKEYVARYLEPRKLPKTLVRYPRPDKEYQYKYNLWKFQQGTPFTLQEKIRQRMPVDMRDAHGLPIQVVAPFDFNKPVSKDTTHK